MTQGPRKESARRWIRSSRERWQAAAPLHTQWAYEAFQCTCVYVVSRPGMSRTAYALRRKLIRWAARTATEFRWWLKLNVLSKVTPIVRVPIQKKTSLNGCSFLSPGRKVCLLILKEEGLKMMNPFVGRKKSCRMLSKRNFFPPLSDGRYPPRIPNEVHVPAFKLVLTSIGLQLRHA